MATTLTLQNTGNNSILTIVIRMPSSETMLRKQPKRLQEAITSSGDFPPPSARTVSLNRLPVSSIAYETGIQNIIIYIDAIGKWDKKKC